MAGPYGLMDQPAEVQGAELAPELTRYAVYLLRRVVSRFGSDTTARSTAAREFVVLSELAGTEGLSQQDLGERLDINRTVMVRLIDKLEHDGVVSRERNPRNRRSYILALTEPGRAALTRMREAIADFDRVHDGSLLPAELDRLKELLVALHPESGSAAGIFQHRVRDLAVVLRTPSPR